MFLVLLLTHVLTIPVVIGIVEVIRLNVVEMISEKTGVDVSEVFNDIEVETISFVVFWISIDTGIVIGIVVELILNTLFVWKVSVVLCGESIKFKHSLLILFWIDDKLCSKITILLHIWIINVKFKSAHM